MTSVLITGAFGLLGSSLAPQLLMSGYDVIRHSRRALGDVVADLTNSSETESMLDSVQPNVVVNLAALTNVDECEYNPQQAYLLNVRIVENLVRWIKKKDSPCYLIQISTDQIYDGVGPHSEDNVTITNTYGFSKYAGELVASCIPSTILRTSFFGNSQSANRKSLSDWLIESLKQKTPIKVFDDVRFSPLSLPSLVKMIELSIEKKHPGIYNLGARNGMSKADFAYELASVLALATDRMQRESFKSVKLAANRPKNMCMDSSKFEKIFNIQLPTLKEEIALIGEMHCEYA